MTEPCDVRAGTPGDLLRVLELFDAAVAWLVARGSAGQWGSEPFSASPAMREHLSEIAARGEPRVALAADHRIVGFYVLGGRPAYAPRGDEPERYLEAMVTDRTLAGSGIGGALVADAIARARASGVRLVRTDCWAGSPRLIRWYEEHGFERAGSLLVGDWPGQLLERRI